MRPLITLYRHPAEPLYLWWARCESLQVPGIGREGVEYPGINVSWSELNQRLAVGADRSAYSALRGLFRGRRLPIAQTQTRGE